MKKIALAVLLVVGLNASAAGAGYDALNVGIQYSNDESWSAAILWLNKAIDAGDLLPDQTRVAYFNRARAYTQTGKYPMAIADYTAALALAPDDIGLLVARAFTYIYNGQGELAAADLQRAHERRPKSAIINFYAGLVHWTLGRPEAASPVFTDALKVSKSSYTWLWLKLSDMKQKRETAPYSERRYYWPAPLVDLYSGKGKEEAVFEKVKEYGDDESCEAAFYVAEWRLAHNDVAGGKTLLQKAVDDCPNGDLELQMAKLELGKLP